MSKSTDTSPGNRPSRKVVVIGAGIGGLTTAGLLARAGFDVTVLEAHVYPGGCAGTFYHQKYRFDAGATLAGGFYPGGPMDILAQRLGIDRWPTTDDATTDDATTDRDNGAGNDGHDSAMTVHFPDGSKAERWGDDKRHDERDAAFGNQSAAFFRWQENTADLLWDLALRTPPWPPQTVREGGQLIWKGLGWLIANAKRLPAALASGLVADAFRPVASRYHGQTNKLRLFIDAQLLIASQTTGKDTNALYGASALDLPRRGVVHLFGGIGAIATTIADAFQASGGTLRYREEVTQINFSNGRPTGVTTKRGNHYDADLVIANLPPWNIQKLISDESMPPKLRGLDESPQSGGGAFMVYVGLDDNAVPADSPLHHQVIVREPMGEGNTVFLSLSPKEDEGRAPAGKRALTISTHTHIDPWWQLFQQDSDRYEKRKEHYTNMMLSAAERVFPALREHAELIKSGTPVTFKRFTRREWGWVGGFPQVNLFQTWGPRLGPDLWMVGDTIFPGQSTAAVALGGLRVANTIITSSNCPSALRSTREATTESTALHDNDKLRLVDPARSTPY